MASGVAAAANYVFGFITKKTYYNLETSLSLPGVSLLYTFICFCGLLLTYKILPETENRSLEDIEDHFSDNSKSITDRKIIISRHAAKKSKKQEESQKIHTVSMNIDTKHSDNKTGIDNKAYDAEK